MKLNVTVEDMVKHKLLPNQVMLLLFLYHKDYASCRDLFGKELSIELRNSLVSTDFILSDETTMFKDTLLSKKHVEKLLGIRGDNINFWEFYNCYPVKVGTRILRAAGNATQVAQKHEKKYLARVKTIAAHEKAIKAVEAFVNKKKAAGELKFLPNMETVMNNSLWEQWEVFIEEKGKEGQDWNSTTI
jgi:hypothetical protein